MHCNSSRFIILASGYAVELLVSLLQSSNPAIDTTNRLGRIPHQIRGNLSNQETLHFRARHLKIAHVVRKEFSKNLKKMALNL